MNLPPINLPANDPFPAVVDVVAEKFGDAETPGFQAEFAPDEAARAGAFKEDALSESDALQSTSDPSN
jgi:hypothetical protein